MTAVVDTSVLIDYLRGDNLAARVLEGRRLEGPLWASEVTRVEILAGMRGPEEAATRGLLATLRWVPLDDHVAEVAGDLGRRWLPSHRGIDSADLVIAATCSILRAELLTRNVKHFPMVPGLVPPY